MATKLYNIISALQAVDTSLWSKLSGVQNALTGYLSGSAVSNKFAEIDSAIAGLKSSGADSALTGLTEGAGITITGTTQNKTVAVTNYAAITGALVGFDATSTVNKAITGSLKDAKDYTDTASGALKTAYEAADSALSTALINGATTYKTFKAVEDKITTNIADISYISGEVKSNDADITYISGEVKSNDTDIANIQSFISGTNGLQAQITANDGDISTLSSALNGYTGASAVSTKIAAVDAALAVISGTGAGSITSAANKALADAKSYTDTASGALDTRIKAAEGKLDGISTTVTGYVDSKISQYSLDKALTGVVDPQDVITLGTTSDQKISGKFLYNSDVFKVSSNKLDVNFKLSSIQSGNGQTTEFAIVDNAGNKLGDTINIATESILSTATYSADPTSGDILTLVFKTGTGTTTTIVDMKDLINKNELSADLATAVNGLSGEIFGDGKLSATFKSAIDTNTSNISTLSTNVYGASGLSSHFENEISYVSGQVKANDGDISYLSSVLGGYTTANAVSAAISAAQKAADDAKSGSDSGLGDLEGKLSAAYAKDYIVIGDTTGITSSEFKIGKDTTDILTGASLSTVATEAAVSAAFKKYDESFSDLYSLIDALNEAIKGKD